MFRRRGLGHDDECYSWATLIQDFDFEGRCVPLLSQQGIFKPAVLPEIPLSIRTTPADPRRPRPYDDVVDRDGLLGYRFRVDDPEHYENLWDRDMGKLEALREERDLAAGERRGRTIHEAAALLLSGD